MTSDDNKSNTDDQSSKSSKGSHDDNAKSPKTSALKNFFGKAAHWLTKDKYGRIVFGLTMFVMIGLAAGLSTTIPGGLMAVSGIIAGATQIFTFIKNHADKYLKKQELLSQELNATQSISKSMNLSKSQFKSAQVNISDKSQSIINSSFEESKVINSKLNVSLAAKQRLESLKKATLEPVKSLNPKTPLERSQYPNAKNNVQKGSSAITLDNLRHARGKGMQK